jgi:hypothetical protein
MVHEVRVNTPGGRHVGLVVNVLTHLAQFDGKNNRKRKAAAATAQK